MCEVLIALLHVAAMSDSLDAIIWFNDHFRHEAYKLTHENRNFSYLAIKYGVFDVFKWISKS